MDFPFWMVRPFLRLMARKRVKLFSEENAALTADPVVFFGDSITEYCDLSEYYPGLYAVNRGISGENIEELTERLNVSVADAHPKAVVLLAGINNMMNTGHTPEKAAQKYTELLDRMVDVIPGVPVICQSVYPGWDGDPSKAERVFPIAYLKDDIKKLNVYIKGAAREHGYVYADVHRLLAADDGIMRPEYSFDGCHPSPAGYEVASSFLRPEIEKLI